jgi:NADPH2:quinone reductase
MKAVGDKDVLELSDVPEPEILNPTQIKVELHAAGINPIDTKIRKNGLFYNAQPPAILGCDGAGSIVAVGQEVTRFQPGDNVWFCHGGLGREPGNYAEFSVLEESRAEFSPARIPQQQSAASPLGLITAWEALYDRGQLQPDQTVLIHAGAGGVGHIAIQLAKIRGAKVITTVSNKNKAEFAAAVGADDVINYKTQNLDEAVSDITRGKGVNLVFDTGGGDVFRQYLPLLAEYGTLVTILDPGDALVTAEARNKNLSIAFTLMLTPALKDLTDALAHQGRILRLCGEWMSEGKLKVAVTQTYPLADAAAAHELIETGHTRGKLVLTMK